MFTDADQRLSPRSTLKADKAVHDDPDALSQLLTADVKPEMPAWSIDTKTIRAPGLKQSMLHPLPHVRLTCITDLPQQRSRELAECEFCLRGTLEA